MATSFINVHSCCQLVQNPRNCVTSWARRECPEFSQCWIANSSRNRLIPEAAVSLLRTDRCCFPWMGKSFGHTFPGTSEGAGCFQRTLQQTRWKMDRHLPSENWCKERECSYKIPRLTPPVLIRVDKLPSVRMFSSNCQFAPHGVILGCYEQVHFLGCINTV